MRLPAREDVLFFGGLILVGLGCWQLAPGLAGIVVGLALVLVVVPLSKWWR